MKNKLLYGVGTNDADYNVVKIINGKQSTCKYYTRWAAMIGRCYDAKRHKRNPAYIDCTVCDEWLYFSSFKLWMMGQGWEGKELDKDIISIGNKVYSAETCCFVTQELNSLLVDKPRARGDYPRGVSLNKRDGNFVAYIRKDKKSKNLGYFLTPELASKAYIAAKVEMINLFIVTLSDQRIINGLLAHARALSAKTKGNKND